MNETIDFAVIGGSGLYSMSGLDEVKDVELDTPFGKPSAPIILGSIGKKRIAFLARHGIGHHISPSEVNYRANIYALKSLGVNRIVSISACGSLREDYAPGHIVIPDQIFDFTHKRARTFFENGIVAHVGTADPFCASWSKLVYESVVGTGATVHQTGTLITIEGPRFSTKAESNQYRSWGLSIIGMTAAPEAFLAREAEICYATMAHVTDYDVWHENIEPVSVEMVIQTLNKNTSTAQTAIRTLALKGSKIIDCSCGNSLASAIITHPESMPPEIIAKYQLLIGKYLKKSN
jgi:5'-methylthioadenosine phosphorylase